MSGLLQELNRRNVFRVAVAYLVASWLVLQVADVVLDGIGAPDWVMKVFLLVAFLGFPVVVVFSWAYELTPEGLKREKEVDRSKSITRQTGRRLNLITIGMLVAVLAVFVIDRMFFHDHVTEVPAAADPVADKSIAVLAFEDLSPEGDQAYFAEGLSEELLNVLARHGELQVAGRTSSFAFKGQNKDLREIGELLNVAHILEGSVRKAGNRIRVTAQLIKASDGFHLFSETYDRELSDVFAVQDEIAAAISDTLLTEIVGTEAVTTATRTDPEAYELYLLARQRIHTRDPTDMEEASAMLDRALEIDPIYAPALAQKALVIHLLSDSLGSYGTIPFAESYPASKKLVDQALALDDNLAEAHAVYGLLLSNTDNVHEAIESLQRAREINPTMSNVGNWLAQALVVTGERSEAIEIYEEVVDRDPTYGPAFGNLAAVYTSRSDFDKADAVISRVSRIVGENDDVLQSRGIVHVMRGMVADAAKDLSKAYADNPNSSIVQMWYGFALLGLADHETLLDVGLPEHRMLAHVALGQRDEAYEALHSIDMNATLVQRVLSEMGVVFNADNNSQGMIDYVNETFGSIDELLEAHPTTRGWGTGYLAELAYACLQTGDEAGFERLRSLMGDILATNYERGIDNWVIRINEAEYAALSGDVEEALASIEGAIDTGFRAVGGLDSGVFSGLRGEPRFDELRQKLATVVDEERAKLGLPPYRPIPATEDKPSFVN